MHLGLKLGARWSASASALLKNEGLVLLLISSILKTLPETIKTVMVGLCDTWALEPLVSEVEGRDEQRF